VPESSGDSEQNSEEKRGSLGKGAISPEVCERHLTVKRIEESSRQNLRRMTTKAQPGAGIVTGTVRTDPTMVDSTKSNQNTASQFGWRVGRLVSSPLQLGQTAPIEQAHSGQKVHS